jgi:hypothetical protein
MSESQKSPTIQIIIDLHGAPVERRHLQWALACVGQMWGAEKMQPAFWITRTDLLHAYLSQNQMVDQSLRVLGDEPRHEPSFDLYHDGGIVPVLRIINVAPARPEHSL